MVGHWQIHRPWIGGLRDLKIGILATSVVKVVDGGEECQVANLTLDYDHETHLEIWPAHSWELLFRPAQSSTEELRYKKVESSAGKVSREIN